MKETNDKDIYHLLIKGLDKINNDYNPLVFH